MGRRDILRGTLVSSSLALVFVASVASAADINWLGGSGNWSAVNWSATAFPSSFADTAAIDAGNALASSVTLDVSASIGGLTIDAGDALSIPGSALTVQGAINNNGSLLVSGSGQLIVQSISTLGGTGQTSLAGGTLRGASLLGTEELTIGAGHNVHGIGQIASLKVVNHGSVVAEAGGELGISMFLNHGTIEVADGGLLSMSGIVTGGEIRGAGNARLRGGIIHDAALSGTLNVADNSVIGIGGTISNNGMLKVVGDGFSGGIYVHGAAATLAGTGTTVLDNAYLGSSQSGELTIGPDQTVRGSGRIGPFMTRNRGRIVAEGEGGLRITLTSIEQFSNEGLVEIADGSFLSFASVLQGGEVRGYGSARLFGGVLRDSTLSGTLNVQYSPGFLGKVGIGGTIANNALLTVGSPGQAASNILVHGNAVLG